MPSKTSKKITTSKPNKIVITTNKSNNDAIEKSFIEKILTFENNDNVYRYKGKRIILFRYDNDIWFSAAAMARILQYRNTKKAISAHVNPQNKKPFSQFDKNKFTYRNARPQAHSLFINIEGLKQLVSKANKPEATVLAKKMGIDVYQKITRIEIDIVHELNVYCEHSGIQAKPQYTPKKSKYAIDYYLPEYRLAIEIDENNHKDRDPIYEKDREKQLKKILGCQFIRCNPDDPDFSIGDLLGQINKHVINFNKNQS